MKQRKIRIGLWTICITLGAVCLFGPDLMSADRNLVHVIELDDATINPVTAEYITKSIEKAHEENAQCLIIKLDTPGGLLTSTRMIVKKILTADIPVVVYISPSGSRAGSAGVFITYASHIAAMAPSTNIGAAHPVQLGNGKKEKGGGDFWDGLKELLQESREKKESSNENEELKDEASSKTKKTATTDKPVEKDSSEDLTPDADPMSSKILQDTVAFIKTIAEKRNRNIDWAIRSVTKSSSVTEKEALELGVVEIIADDIYDLLDKIDGRVVEIDHEKIALKTKDARVVNIGMDFRQRFFNVLANPNIAYILMILGFYGLLYEITHPGIGVPGILGSMFLILAFFSMQTLPTNYAGVALVILGLLLFIAEAMAPGIGLLALGGIISLILGSLLLFDTYDPIMTVSKMLILGFALPMAAVSIIILRAAVKMHQKKPISGDDGMVGEKGEVTSNIKVGAKGKVFVHGETWNAVSDETLKKGDAVVVKKIDGMTLKVERLKKGE